MMATSEEVVGRLATTIERIVLDKIAGDRLRIAVLPTLAQEALAVLRRPDVGAKEVAKIISRDATMTATALRQANSAAFGGGGLATIEQATSRLGLKKMEAIIVASTAQNLFVSRDSRIAGACAAMWDHSLAVAQLARDLAAVFGNIDEEQAFLVGLLHDVGKPVIAAMLLEAERHLGHAGWIDADGWLQAIRTTHRTIGTALAQKWALPEPVVAAIRECSEYDASNRSSVTNFVCFANALAKVHGISTPDADVEDAKALVMVGRSLLGIDDEIVNRLARSLKDRSKADAA